jgi:hypothetical protein
MLAEFTRGAAAAGAEVFKFSVAERRVEPCRGCSACETTGQCVIDSDDMNELYPLLSSAKRIVVSTPLFFYDVPALGKALIDRTQVLWARRYALKQDPPRPEGRGFLLALGATRGRDLFVPVTLSIKYFFDALGFPKTFESLFFRQVEAKGDLEKRPDDLRLIFEAGLAFGRRADFEAEAARP